MKVAIVILLSISTLSLYFNQKNISYSPIKKESNINEISQPLSASIYKKWTISNVIYKNINCKNYQPKDMINSTTVTLTETNINGSGPVNNFSANLNTQKNQLVIYNILSTKKYGPGSCVEEKLFSFLKSNLTFQIKNNELILLSDIQEGISTIYFKSL